MCGCCCCCCEGGWRRRGLVSASERDPAASSPLGMVHSNINYLCQVALLTYYKEGSDGWAEKKAEVTAGKVVSIASDHASGLYFIKDGKFTVAFCGTNDAKDLMADLNVWQVPFWCGDSDVHCGMVASGFFAYYQLLKRQFWPALQLFIQQEPESEDKELVFTGHSLGASVCMAALEASFLPNCPPIRLVTFGSPRMGNRRFKQALEARVPNNIRVTDALDPIPAVPTRCRFRHAGEQYVLGTVRGLRNSTVCISIMRCLCLCECSSDVTRHLLTSYNKLLQELHISSLSPRIRAADRGAAMARSIVKSGPAAESAGAAIASS